MEAASLSVTCPCCAARVATDLPEFVSPWPDERDLDWDILDMPNDDQDFIPLPPSDRDFDGRVSCPFCDWEFCVDPKGWVTDDGEFDRDPLFEVNDDGELTSVDVCRVHCLHCSQPFDFEGGWIGWCPHCDWTAEIDSDGRVLSDGYLHRECRECGANMAPAGEHDLVCRQCGRLFWEGPVPWFDQPCCPHCESCFEAYSDDCDARSFVLIEGTLVYCEECGWIFHSPELAKAVEELDEPEDDGSADEPIITT